MRNKQNIAAGSSMLLVLAAFALIIPVETCATEQIPDGIVYKGKRYSSPGLLDGLFEKYRDQRWKWMWEGKGWCSGAWRGYIATYEVVGKELRLKDITKDCDEVIPPRKPRKYPWGKETMRQKFLATAGAKDSVLKMDWVTGDVVLFEGECLYLYGLSYLYGIYERQIVLNFEKGVLVKETRMNCLEYLEYLRKNPVFGEGNYKVALPKLEYYMEMKKGEKSEYLAGIKTKYQKMFGRPISDFEFATEKVRVKVFENYELTLTRTLNGVRAIYDSKDRSTDDYNVELDMGEWLKFVKALYECRIDTWVKEYDDYNYKYDDNAYKIWGIDVYFSGDTTSPHFRVKDPYLTSLPHFRVKDPYLRTPPNWGAFKKTIDGMITLIRVGPAVKALETKLEAEYKRIYGVPISALERTASEVSFYAWRRDSVERHFDTNIVVLRTETGALAWYEAKILLTEEREYLNVELDMEEWLSFIRAVFKCRVSDWKKSYSDNSTDKENVSWGTEFFFTDRDGFRSHGNRAYPPNWAEFKTILDALKAKMKDDDNNEQ